jgi:hypothetical protein
MRFARLLALDSDLSLESDYFVVTVGDAPRDPGEGI